MESYHIVVGVSTEGIPTCFFSNFPKPKIGKQIWFEKIRRNGEVHGRWVYKNVDKPYGPLNCNEIYTWDKNREVWYIRRKIYHGLTSIYLELINLSIGIIDHLKEKIHLFEIIDVGLYDQKECMRLPDDSLN